MVHDVLIIGGGPGGLSAALALGRARKRVLLCDSGPRRNAAAVHVHNFLTRDGVTPDELRRVAREQLNAYPNVEVRDVRVETIAGTRGAFRAEVGSARRVLLCTGMIDQMLAIDGFRELWGQAIFQCPHCHGWEVQERRWGYLARADDAAHLSPFALQLRGWTRDVVVFKADAFDVPADTVARLAAAGIRVESDPVARLAARADRLEAVVLSSGATVPCDVLFAHPPQRHVEVVRSLGVELDEQGYVRVDPMTRATSIAGIYAAGDLTTRMQSAIVSAAAGLQAAAMINIDLAMDSS